MKFFGQQLEVECWKPTKPFAQSNVLLRVTWQKANFQEFLKALLRNGGTIHVRRDNSRDLASEPGSEHCEFVFNLPFFLSICNLSLVLTEVPSLFQQDKEQALNDTAWHTLPPLAKGTFVSWHIASCTSRMIWIEHFHWDIWKKFF